MKKKFKKNNQIKKCTGNCSGCTNKTLKQFVWEIKNDKLHGKFLN